MHPPAIGFLGYLPDPKFTSGTKAAQRSARRRIAAKVMSGMFHELRKYAKKGTLIEWPWGNLSGRDEHGRIRIFPWVTGFPVDGPEAKKMSGIRGQSGVCPACERRSGQPPFVAWLCNSSNDFYYHMICTFIIRIIYFSLFE